MSSKRLDRARHLSARLKAGLMLVAALYLPLIGLVVIGQYVMPVYAGLGVCVLGLVRKHPWMLAAGLWLLSFKWHIGAIPGLAALLLAATYGRAFLVQAVGNTLVIVLLASCVGIAAGPPLASHLFPICARAIRGRRQPGLRHMQQPGMDAHNPPGRGKQLGLRSPAVGPWCRCHGSAKGLAPSGYRPRRHRRS